MLSAIVLAAGKGTRMHSDMAKSMHKVMDKPMIQHIYDTVSHLGGENFVLVVGHAREQIEDWFGDKASYAIQEPQLGSGHAVMQATQLKDVKGKTLIISGDCPLIQEDTYRTLLAKADEAPLVLMTAVLEDARSYGRIVRDEEGNVLRIVERKDANEEEVKIREINAGIYCVDNELLWKYLPEIGNNNAQHEYYITDLVAIFRSHGHKVAAVVAEDPDEMSGINTRGELVNASKWLQNRINNYWLDHGVTITDPATVWISPDVTIGTDTVIYGNVRIEGHTVIGRHCTITEGSYLKDAVIGDECQITSSRVIDTELPGCQNIGPWVELKSR